MLTVAVVITHSFFYCIPKLAIGETFIIISMS